MMLVVDTIVQQQSLPVVPPRAHPRVGTMRTLDSGRSTIPRHYQCVHPSLSVQ